MSEPKRWLDDGGAPREIVDALRAMAPPKPAPATVQRKLAIGFAESGGARGVLAVALASRVSRLSAALVVGGGVAFAAARGALVRKGTAASVPADIALAAQIAPKRGAAGEVSPLEEPSSIAASPLTTSEAAAQAPPDAVDHAKPARVTSHASAARRAEPADTLAQEESILEDARRAVAASPEQALHLLNVHQRRFPSGELTAERMFLRTDALQRLGRAADARRQADTLVKRFPTSAYARLVPTLVSPAP
jgi:hypothetical protein